MEDCVHPELISPDEGLLSSRMVADGHETHSSDRNKRSGKNHFTIHQNFRSNILLPQIWVRPLILFCKYIHPIGWHNHSKK